MRLVFVTWMGLAGVSFVLPADAAHTIELADRNSSVRISPDHQFSGMFDWKVEGTSHLLTQWLLYRKGPSDGERGIALIPGLLGTPPTEGPGDLDGSPGIEALSVEYRDFRLVKVENPPLPPMLQPTSTFSIEVNHLLVGGAVGSGESTLSRSITLTNLTSDPLEIHFFVMLGFNVGGSIEDQVFNRMNPHVFVQRGLQASAQTVFNPAPDHFEADWPLPMIGRFLNDEMPTILTDAIIGGPSGKWYAVQYDLNIPPHQSKSITLASMISSSSTASTPVPDR